MCNAKDMTRNYSSSDCSLIMRFKVKDERDNEKVQQCFINDQSFMEEVSEFAFVYSCENRISTFTFFLSENELSVKQ